jgi:serine/threonine-protein kinase
MVAVLSKEPDWTPLPATTPSSIRRLLRRSLEKDRRRRLSDMADARLEIDEALAAPVGGEGVAVPAALAVPPRPLWRRALPLLLTAVVVGLLTAIGAWSLRPSTPAAPITRFPLTLPEGLQFASTGRQVLAMSPDGSQIAYIANQHLYLRSMGDLQPRPIPGAETLGAGLAFSPDGQSIAFNSLAPDEPQALKIIAVNGGTAVRVCEIGPLYDMSWGGEGILLGQGSKGILQVLPNGSGKPKTMVSVKDDELAHGPQILPGGEWVLFTLAKGVANDRWDRAQIFAQSLKSGQRKMLIDGGSDARYVPTGHIVFAVGGRLFAAPFDVRRLEVTGERVPIVQGVKRSGGLTAMVGTITGTAYFSFSDTGTLIYIPGSVSTTSARSNLVLIDRKGVPEQLKLPADSYQAPRVSPDGKRIVVGTDDGKEAIVWIYELSGTGGRRQLTFGGRNRFPIWADNQRVAFQSDREGDLGIWWQRSDGTSPAVRLTKADEGTSQIPESWSPRGDRLLVSLVKGTGYALSTLSLPDKNLLPFGDVRSQVPTDAVFSSDGLWVAYQSGSTNSTTLLWVEPYQRTDTKYQIGTGSAHHPLWSRGGKELFYVPYAGEPVVAGVSTEPSFSVGDPSRLPTLGVEAGATVSRNYDETRDGRLLRVIDAGQTQSGGASAPQIQVVLNWFEELKARVPAK